VRKLTLIPSSCSSPREHASFCNGASLQAFFVLIRTILNRAQVVRAVAAACGATLTRLSAQLGYFVAFSTFLVGVVLMPIAHIRYVSLAALAWCGAAAAQACSPTAGEDGPSVVDVPVPAPDASADATIPPVTDTTSGKDSAAPDASTQADTSVRDTGSASSDGSADARPDAPADAAADTGAAAAPATGTACPTPGVTFTKVCGFCGKSSAFCEADKTVGTYSYCMGSVVDGCTPGTQRTAACGLCGTRQEVCQNTCQWAGAACLNEPANACTPGSVTYTQTGCIDADKFRKVTCTATCQYASPEPPPCKAKESDSLTLGAAAAAITSGEYKLGTSAAAVPQHDLPGLGGGTCPLPMSGTRAVVSYVKLVNPNATAAKVELYTDAVVGVNLGDPLDVLMTVYNTIPTNDAQRGACVGRVGDENDEDLINPAPECTAPLYGAASLCGEHAVTVPARGFIYVMVQSYESSPSNEGLAFKLSAKVKSL
jgi:hypothetical protein